MPTWLPAPRSVSNPAPCRATRSVCGCAPPPHHAPPTRACTGLLLVNPSLSLHVAGLKGLAGQSVLIGLIGPSEARALHGPSHVALINAIRRVPIPGQALVHQTVLQTVLPTVHQTVHPAASPTVARRPPLGHPCKRRHKTLAWRAKTHAAAPATCHRATAALHPQHHRHAQPLWLTAARACGCQNSSPSVALHHGARPMTG